MFVDKYRMHIINFHSNTLLSWYSDFQPHNEIIVILIFSESANVNFNTY